MDPQQLVASASKISGVLVAIGAFGTASFGLTDSLKLLPGGLNLSRTGFKFIREVMTKLVPSAHADSGALSRDFMLKSLESQWINGAQTDDQVAIAKSLIKLSLTVDTAPTLARATGVAPDILTQVASNIFSGTSLNQQQADVYGRFDLLLTTMLDQAYQHGSQSYRNWSKAWAMVIAVGLGVVSGCILSPPGHFDHHLIASGALIGLISTPLAPIAKDLSSALTAGVQALQASQS